MNEFVIFLSELSSNYRLIIQSWLFMTILYGHNPSSYNLKGLYNVQITRLAALKEMPFNFHCLLSFLSWNNQINISFPSTILEWIFRSLCFICVFTIFDQSLLFNFFTSFNPLLTCLPHTPSSNLDSGVYCRVSHDCTYSIYIHIHIPTSQQLLLVSLTHSHLPFVVTSHSCLGAALWSLRTICGWDRHQLSTQRADVTVYEVTGGAQGQHMADR